MLETIRILNNAEKAFESHLVDDDDDACYESCTQLNKQRVNAKFENVCKNMVQRMWEAQQGDDEQFANFAGWIRTEMYGKMLEIFMEKHFFIPQRKMKIYHW